MNHGKKNSGFTLIELLLAMSFVAALLLAIATVVILISQVYNKGLTLKEVNQISRSVSDDLLRDISASATFSLDAAANQYVNSNPTGSRTGSPTGRICMGTFSYVWNYGWALDSSNSGLSVYNGKSDQIRLVRIPDGDGTYCAVGSNGKLVKSKIDPAVAVELISGTDHNLVLHQFAVTTSPTAVDSLSGQRLYSVAFTLGTNDPTALTTDPTGGVVCKTRIEDGANPSYCSIQQFSLVARTQYGVN